MSRPVVPDVWDAEDAVAAARFIANDLANEEVGKPVDEWGLRRTLARANKIARWASLTLKSRKETTK